MQNSVYLSLMGITQWCYRGAVEESRRHIWSLYDFNGLLKGTLIEGANALGDSEKEAVERLVADISKAMSLRAEPVAQISTSGFVLAFKPDQQQKQAFSGNSAYYEFSFNLHEMLQNVGFKRELWQVMKAIKSNTKTG